MAKKILIVEDEMDLVEMLKFRLERNGYKVSVAYDGEKGLQIAREFSPDLILLDINLPQKGGLELYRELCTAHGRPRFPILILTARGELKGLFENIQADGFMKKPFEAQDLLTEIEKILKKNEQTDAFVIDSKEGRGSAEIAQALKGERYQSILIDGLDQFKQLAPVHKPCFIVMEYMQPSMSGEDFIKELRKILKELASGEWPAARDVGILVYSYSGMDYSEKSLKAGADKYIGKPANYDAIVTAVRQLELKRP